MPSSRSARAWDANTAMHKCRARSDDVLDEWPVFGFSSVSCANITQCPQCPGKRDTDDLAGALAGRINIFYCLGPNPNIDKCSHSQNCKQMTHTTRRSILHAAIPPQIDKILPNIAKYWPTTSDVSKYNRKVPGK